METLNNARMDKEPIRMDKELIRMDREPIQMDPELVAAFEKLRAVTLPATHRLLLTQEGRDWAVDVLVQQGVLFTLARMAAVPEPLNDPEASLWAGFAPLGSSLGMHDVQQAYDDFTEAYPHVVLVGGMFCSAMEERVVRRLEVLKAAQATEITLLISSPGGKVGSLDRIIETLGRLKFETVEADVPGYIASCATMLAMWADRVATTKNTRMLFHEMRVVNPPSDHASITTLHEYRDIVDKMSARQTALTNRTVQPAWMELWAKLGEGDRGKGFETWTEIVSGPISTWPQLRQEYKNNTAAVRDMLMVHCPLGAEVNSGKKGGVLDAIYTLCGNWNDLTLSQSQIVDFFFMRARAVTLSPLPE